MGNPLFAKKPMSMLLAESAEAGTHSLKRTLGPFQLTALGVGAIIGAGIFVLSGLGAHYAGPGLMLSFVLSGMGCAFAGLCYAEFAAMIPLAGSAYTYAYATLAEHVPHQNAVVDGLRPLDGAVNGRKDCGATDGFEFGCHIGARHAGVPR